MFSACGGCTPPSASHRVQRVTRHLRHPPVSRATGLALGHGPSPSLSEARREAVSWQERGLLPASQSCVSSQTGQRLPSAGRRSRASNFSSRSTLLCPARSRNQAAVFPEQLSFLVEAHPLCFQVRKPRAELCSRLHAHPGSCCRAEHAVLPCAGCSVWGHSLREASPGAQAAAHRRVWKRV